MNFRLTVRGLTIAAIVLTVVVVLVGVALAPTSSGTFCGSCKSHVPYVDEWRASAHGGVNCEQCHTKPGPFFFLTSKLEALQQPVHQISGDYEKPILGTVLNQSCRRCHDNDLLFEPVSSSGIRVQHKHLIEAGFLCVRCHSTQAHGSAVPPGSRNYPSMDQCLLCHNNQYTDAEGQVATSRCDVCHVEPAGGAVPLTHKQPRWEDDHGSIGILSTCSACHVRKKFCVDCHSGVAMPHGDKWISAHGDGVKKAGDSKSCQQCHTKQYCGTCHQVPMPHPTGFVSAHPRSAERNGTQTCFNCHQVDNCQACHEQHLKGTPRAHQLFDGVKYTPSPTPSPTSSTVSQEQ